MIGKGKSISHTRASMSYGLQESKKAEIIHRQNVVGDTPGEINGEFKIFQEQNHRCKRNTMSFVLSPTIEDGRNLKTWQLQEIVERFLREMKLRDHQEVAFVHRDREHLHLHVYVNRIDSHGKAYNDHFLGKRTGFAAEAVAKQMGLTTVREVQLQKLENTKEVRSEIKKIHERVIAQTAPKSFDAYMKAMEEKQVRVIPHINKQNELQGFRFEYGGENLKGSQVHPSMSMGKIAEQLDFGKRNVQQMLTAKTMEFLGNTLNVSTRLAQVLADRAIQLAKDREMEI